MKKIFGAFIFPLFVLAASPSASAAATGNDLVIGPYVPSADTVSAVVAFELASPSTASVTVKTEKGDRVFRSEVSQTLHFVEIDGLEPGRAYEYVVSAPLVQLGERGQGLIKTAPLPGGSFTFTVIGDTRPGENKVSVHHAALAEQMALLDPAFSLVLGDLVDDGRDPAQWRVFFEVEKLLLGRAALFPVLGDNDHAGGEGLMPRYFPKLAQRYYSFEWGGVHFFGLSAWDTKGRQPGSEYDERSEQYLWLESQLFKKEVQQAPFRVVFIHDPVFISRGRGARLLQETFAPLFERAAVDIVFASWHLYERSRVNRVNYIISGGGGAELIWNAPDADFKAIADAKRYHFCRVDVSSGGLSLRAVAEDGTVLDRVTLATNRGDDTRDEEFFRFATRMATLETYGDGEKTVVPVYVFDADEKPFQSGALSQAASALGATVAVYSFNLRKKGVFDLLLHAQGVTGATVERLPAVFLKGRYLADLETLPAAFKSDARSFGSDVFKEKSALSDTRRSTFGALTAGAVALNGLMRGLTVGGFAWLIGFGLLLLLVARRGGPVNRTAGVALGVAFASCILWGVFYFDIIKNVPDPDLFATALGPKDSSLVFFEIQAMMDEPTFRGRGLVYLILRTTAALSPAVFVMFVVKMVPRPTPKKKDVTADAA